jgi:hypothetical protein
MTINVTSPVTGTAQTGLTNPTYTVVSDTVPPGKRGKAWAVSALGGTQTGVEANTIGNPFQTSYFGPLNPTGTPVLNATTGQPLRVPHNVHQVVTRKGTEVATGYRYPGNVTTSFNIPGGAEIKDPESIRAMVSCHIGVLSQIASALGDTLVDGTM